MRQRPSIACLRGRLLKQNVRGHHRGWLLLLVTGGHELPGVLLLGREQCVLLLVHCCRRRLVLWQHHDRSPRARSCLGRGEELLLLLRRWNHEELLLLSHLRVASAHRHHCSWLP